MFSESILASNGNTRGSTCQFRIYQLNTECGTLLGFFWYYNNKRRSDKRSISTKKK